MKVRYVHPDQPIRDPVTKRHVGIAEDGSVLPEFEVPETNFFVRRTLPSPCSRCPVPHGELQRMIDNPSQAPVAPLTKR